MKTDDLIARLVDDVPSLAGARPLPARAMILIAVLTVGVTVAASMLLYGVRAAGPGSGIMGYLVWAALAGLALASIARARAPMPVSKRTLLAPVCALLALLGILASLSLADQKSVVRVDHVVHCLQTIGLLAIAPFAALSVLMRRSAPASPVIAGALAGLVAGAIGALAYSVSCPINDPLAALSAHATTVLIIAGIGAVVGWRLYAW
ncbi:MAG: NrsF family protein [Pseudomonadota bacterium]